MMVWHPEPRPVDTAQAEQKRKPGVFDHALGCMVAASRSSDEGRRGPPEFLPRGSQAILHAWRDLRVHGSGEKARALEVPQACRERLRANRPEPVLELRVPQAAVVREGPDDQCGSLLRNSVQDAFEEMRTYIAGQADEGALGTAGKVAGRVSFRESLSATSVERTNTSRWIVVSMKRDKKAALVRPLPVYPGGKCPLCPPSKK